MLARLIMRRVRKWRAEGKTDTELITEFLRMTDHALEGDTFELGEQDIDEYRRRIVTRILPRVVIGFTPHPEFAKLSAFLSELQKPERRSELKKRIEAAIAERLMELRPDLGTDREAALTRAGVWFDAPKPPSFDKLEELFIGDDTEQIELLKVFPISTWIQAYIAYRYYIRVFAFSEYIEEAKKATEFACKSVLGIEDPSFFAAIAISRS